MFYYITKRRKSHDSRKSREAGTGEHCFKEAGAGATGNMQK